MAVKGVASIGLAQGVSIWLLSVLRLFRLHLMFNMLSLDTATSSATTQHKQKTRGVRSQSYGTCVREQPHTAWQELGGGTCGRMEERVCLLTLQTHVFVEVLYSPTIAQLIVLKTMLKLTLKQLRHVSLQPHDPHGAHYSCLLNLQLLK